MQWIRYKKQYLLAIVGLLVFVLLANYLNKSENTDLEKMKVVLHAKVPKDDVFQLFYWEATAPKFTMANSVRSTVKGSSEFQDIEFELPKIKDLFRLRLDIGENLAQGDVAIKHIGFVMGSEKFEFDSKEFNRLFAPNKYIMTPSEGIYSGQRDTLRGKAIYDPYFISVDSSTEMEMISKGRPFKYPYLVSAFVCLAFFLFIGYNLERISISPPIVFIIAFITVLLLPTLQNQFQLVEPLESLEKRELAQLPEFSWSKQYAGAFETYYNDNFGFRNYLVNWGGTYRTKLFRSSIHPEKVMFGRQKWLFYNNFNSHIFDSYRRVNLFSNDTLKLVVDEWAETKKRLESEGRKYFLVFWPNKHSIYPEYMPTTMALQIKDTVSRVDQILQYIDKEKAKIKLTDIRDDLIKAKKGHQLYHKFDTHWNDYGAYLGYQAFFRDNWESLRIAPKRESDFNIVWQEYTGGDLIQMLGVRNNGFFKEMNPKFTLKENKNQIEYLGIEGFPNLTVRTRNKQCGNKLKALIFRDSYSNSIIQFFSLHFYEVTYIWGHKEYYVNKLQPDVVIDAFVEREIGEKHTINKL